MLNLKTKIKQQFRLLISGLFIGGLIFFVSCRSTNDSDQYAIFRYNESNGLGSLDPAYAKDLASINVCEQIYNGLIQLDSNLQIQSSIAKRWQISPDLLTYTFILNDRVYFHDNECFRGEKPRSVTAHDFVFSFKRILDPKVSSPGLWIFNKIDTTWNDKGFYALNDTVLQVRLKEPYAPFLSLLTMKYCSVLAHEALLFYGEEFRKNPVGTGPFKMKFWEEGLKLILEKNEFYFEDEWPLLDYISISFLVDKQSEFLLFLQGEIDYISGLSPVLKDELLNAKGELNTKYQDKIRLLKIPYLNTEYVGILMDTNRVIMSNSPLRSLAFRKALNYSIDKEKMLRYIQNSIGKPAIHGFIPSALWPNGLPKTEGYSYNRAKAEELFIQAKEELSISDFPPIEIAATSKSVEICKFLQHEWSQFGIETKIELNQWAALKEMVANNKVNLFRASWVADYPDAENYLLLFGSEHFSPKGPNYTHFLSKEYDSLLNIINFTPSIEQKIKIYREMDSIIIANAPVIPLFYDEVVRFLQVDIEGFEPNSMNLMVLKKVSKTY